MNNYTQQPSMQVGRLLGVLHLQQMRHTISVRLPVDLAEWLEQLAQRTGVSQGSIIREQLENARAQEKRPFLQLAGRISDGDPDLSMRKGFSEK